MYFLICHYINREKNTFCEQKAAFDFLCNYLLAQSLCYSALRSLSESLFPQGKKACIMQGPDGEVSAKAAAPPLMYVMYICAIFQL